MSKSKWLNLGLILSSLVVHLQWGDRSEFIAEMEWQLLVKLIDNPLSVFHPFTILPLAGQAILIITLFQTKASKKLSLIGLGMIGFLIYFIFFIGLMNPNEILISTVPFVTISIASIMHFRGRKY